jgi:N-acetylmuramoyl-L-alanine amidase CwlA
MNKYSIPKENVIRHYDVTGKLCPEYWSGNAKNDGLWKTEFWNKIGNKNATTTTPNDIWYRVQIGAFRNRNYAEDFLKTVKAAGFKDAFITTTK